MDCENFREGQYTLIPEGFPPGSLRAHAGWRGTCDDTSRRKGQIEIITSSHCALLEDRVRYLYTDCRIWHLFLILYSATTPHHVELSTTLRVSSLGACRLYFQVTIVSCCTPVMDPDRCEDSGEMYSPDDQGEYTSLDETPRFSLQWLSDALADVGEGMGKTTVEEYALTLEVMMADRPGRPCPPTFSWNAGMVMHILKSDPVLQELEHVQVDGPGTAYLFFYDKQGHRGLEQDATDAV